MELNFPTDRDTKTATPDPEAPPRRGANRLFRVQPDKDGAKAENRLLIPLMDFSKTELFSDWDFQNYYLRVWTHVVEQFNEQGNSYRAFVLCPKKMNDYVRQLSTPSKALPAFFSSSECRMCDHSQKVWDAYAAAKKEAGIYEMTTEEFKVAMDNHPEIQELKNSAKAWGPIERHYFPVFDYDKYQGKKALDEGEERVTIQGLWGPKKLAERLNFKKSKGSKFWEFDTGNARVVVLERDTTTSLRNCKYEVDTEDAPPVLDGETIAYLESGVGVPDPSEDLLVWKPEEMEAYISRYTDSSTVRTAEAPVVPATETVVEKGVAATTSVVTIDPKNTTVQSTPTPAATKPARPAPKFPPEESSPQPPLATPSVAKPRVRQSW